MPSALLSARSSNCVSTSSGGDGGGGDDVGGTGSGDGKEYMAGDEAKMICIAPVCVHAIPRLLSSRLLKSVLSPLWFVVSASCHFV